MKARLLYLLALLLALVGPVVGQTVIRLNANSVMQADAFTTSNSNNLITGVNANASGTFNWARVSKTGSSLADLTTRSATDLTSGTLPDARFPATLPALSGVNLTALNATQLTSGTVPNASLDADLQTYAGITPSANVQSLLGAADYSAMRTQLGLVISTNVQAYDADLATWATVTPSAALIPFLGNPSYANLATALTGAVLVTRDGNNSFTGINTAPTAAADTSTTQLATTAFAKAEADAAQAASQPLDADLTTYAGITPSANVQSYLAAADYAAMRTLLALTIGTNVQAYDADLTTWAGITPSANVQTLLGSFTSANLGTALSDETGTGVAVFNNLPTFTNAGIAMDNADNFFRLIIKSSAELLTNDRTLSINTNNASRSISFAGNLSVGGDATVVGMNTGDQTTVTGNAGTATALQTARSIGGVSFNGTADIVPQTVAIGASTDTSTFILVVDTTGGNQQPKTATGLTYNADSGIFGAPDITGSNTVSGASLISTGNFILPKTITAGGTTGARTIDKLTGSVNFAAGATSLVVTNGTVGTSSVITATVATNDTTMKSVSVVAASGSFTLYPNAAPTGETRVNFIVTN